MKNAVYWIALQSALGYGCRQISQILENFDNVEDLFDKNLSRSAVKFLSDKQYKSVKSADLKKAQGIIDYCERKDIEIVTLDDDKYPVILCRIINPPCVLYVRGTLPDFDDEVGIGMVGTRNCSMNGMIAASTLAYRMAQAGAIVISGGALGIDTKCSQGAIFAKKPSIIIRPCGVDYNYLSDLKDIRKQVESCGAVISEVQPLGKVERNAFQIRNRLISALSLGLVVIEAPLKSGTMITVAYSLEYGKDIYALPGDISDENYSGSNKLLQEGATPVYTPADVLNEYLSAFPHRLNLNKAGIPLNEDDIYMRLQRKYSKPANKSLQKPKKKSIVKKVKEKFEKSEEEVKIKQKLSQLPFDADDITKSVYDCFSNNPISTDEIIDKTGYDASDVMFALTDLEINGVIKQLPGGRFELK